MAGQQQISIDSEGISALGRRLGDIANYLEDKARASNADGVETYGFPTWFGSDGYEKAVGDYELQRKQICRELRDLRDLAKDAGDVYVETERLIDSRNRGVL